MLAFFRAINKTYYKTSTYSNLETGLNKFGFSLYQFVYCLFVYLSLTSIRGLGVAVLKPGFTPTHSYPSNKALPVLEIFRYFFLTRWPSLALITVVHGTIYSITLKT
jgi:hypothetical protein